MDCKNSGSITILEAINRSVHFHDIWWFRGWILDIIFTRDCFFSFRTLATSIMELPSESFYSNRNENNRLKASIRKERRSFSSALWKIFIESIFKCLDNFLFFFVTVWNRMCLIFQEENEWHVTRFSIEFYFIVFLYKWTSILKTTCLEKQSIFWIGICLSWFLYFTM